MSDPYDAYPPDEDTKGIGAHLTWIVLGAVLVIVVIAALTTL